MVGDVLCSLQKHARQLMAQMGSSMLELMDFRDVWGFVGQKGIDGMSTIEYVRPQ
jgi:hypothetical protein